MRILTADTVRPTYYVQTGSMYENPYGVPPAEIRNMEASLPEEIVAQVIYGKYVENSGLVFSASLLGNLFEGQEVRGDKWVHPNLATMVTPVKDAYDMPRPKWPFVAAADVARMNDYTVIMVFDTSRVPDKPGRLVFYWRLNRVDWEVIYGAIAYVACLFDCPVVLDSTGIGDVVLNECEVRFYCHKCDATVPFSLSGGTKICPQCGEVGQKFDVEGFNFAGKRKEHLLTRLQQALAYGSGVKGNWGLLRMPRIEQVAKELTFYRKDDSKLETDCVMSLALAANQLEFDAGDSAIGSVHGE